MTRRPRHNATINFPISHIFTEGPTTTRDAANLRTMCREIHLLETTLRAERGEITELRDLLISRTSEEHWEVPG